MQEPSEQIGWTVIVLLAIAAIIANTLIPRVINDPEQGILAIILFMVFIAICGVLGMRYMGKGGSS